MKAIHVTLHGDPIGKPRMTQADKWRRRPCVLAYRAWADKARYAVRAAPSSIGFHVDGQFVAGIYEVSWIAFVAMPASWPKKKKEALRGQLHFGKPDRDNIDKAILDALFPDDRGVATGTLPTANGSVTIANAATPTVAELQEFCVELKAKVDAIVAALKA